MQRCIDSRTKHALLGTCHACHVCHVRHGGRGRQSRHTGTRRATPMHGASLWPGTRRVVGSQRAAVPCHFTWVARPRPWLPLDHVRGGLRRVPGRAGRHRVGRLLQRRRATGDGQFDGGSTSTATRGLDTSTRFAVPRGDDLRGQPPAPLGSGISDSTSSTSRSTGGHSVQPPQTPPVLWHQWQHQRHQRPWSSSFLLGPVAHRVCAQRSCLSDPGPRTPAP